MRILTLDNVHYDLDHLPEEVDDMRFAILDNSNPQEPDYHFIPLIFLESFNAPALVLRIGENTIKMPMDWQILIGEPEIGDLEVLPLTSINDRGFRVFQFNPLTSFRPSFPDIEILDVYHEVSWYAPKLKNGQLLAVPLNNDPDPDCVYFVKDISRNCEIVDYNKSWLCAGHTLNMATGMGTLKPDATYIYERVGNEVYARESGAEPSTRELMGYSYDPVTGHHVDYDSRTSDGRPLHDHLMETKMWADIHRLARTTPALQDALERVIMIYRLIKVDK
jgi:hypothetical protein